MIQPVSTPIICEKGRKEPKTHHTFPWYQYTYGIVSRNKAIMDKNSGIWLKINFEDKEKWAILT